MSDGPTPPPGPAPLASPLPVRPPPLAPPNYLVWAILATVLCFWPLGLVAIVFSTQVNTKWARGDVQGAQASSRKARTFAIVTTVVGMCAYVIAFVFFVFVLSAGWGPTRTTP
jgi:hypothetical protein